MVKVQREAENLVAVGANLAEFERIVVPQPVPDYCTQRVLTMQRVRGTKITKLSGFARMDINGTALICPGASSGRRRKAAC